MSSSAAPVFRYCAAALAFSMAINVSPSLVAQDRGSIADEPADDREDGTRSPSTRRQFEGVDLSVTVPKEEDELLEQDCEDQADAGRIAGEIVVCRQLGQATDGSWNKEEWQRDYAERTKGQGTPDTFGIANHGNPIGFGSAPPPALMIDIEALPEAPEGSDADRIARGLPPLNQGAQLTPEKIAERRRALGLSAPPVRPKPE